MHPWITARIVGFAGILCFNYNDWLGMLKEDVVHFNEGSSGTLGNAKGSPDEHDNIDAGCKICFAPHMSWKGFNGSKNNRTATEQIA